jgi:hypothetical protein
VQDPWLVTNEIRRTAERAFAEIFTGDDAGELSTEEAVIRRAEEVLGAEIEVYQGGDASWENYLALTLTVSDDLLLPSKYKILIRSDKKAYYRTFNVFHELAHILLGHPPSEVQLPDTFDFAAMGVTSGDSTVRHAKQFVFDGEDVAPTRRIIEGEAEEFARLMVSLVMHPRYRSGERRFG